MPIQGSTTASFVLGARTTPQSNTISLLPFNGTIGDTTTQDAALPHKYITFYGNAHLDSDAKFGSTSLHTQGGQDRVEVLLSERVYTTFTAEAWVKWSFFSDYTPIFSLGVDTDNQMDLSTNGSSSRLRIKNNGSMAFDQVAFGVSFTINRWYHVVLTCDGTDMRINVDGDARAYFYNTTNPFISSKLTIGNFTDGTEPIGGHIGHIDDFRLTKDVKYLYSFDPPLYPIETVNAPLPKLRAFIGSFNSRQDSTIIICGFDFTSDWTSVNFYDNMTGELISNSNNAAFLNRQQVSVSNNTTTYPFVDGRMVDIEIVNIVTGQSVRYNQAMMANNNPVWQTAEGTIVNQTMPNRNISVLLSSTLAFGSDTIRYSVINGSLPPGTDLNATTGFISGLGPTVTRITTWVVVIRATANNDINRVADRTFKITFNP